jgi:hypothetical protein
VTTSGVYLLGVISPFAIFFLVAGLFFLKRKLGATLLYAKPKYLERRISLAAEFVDARRAYRFGGQRVWVAISVGRQFTHDEQARAVLLDEFLPRTEEPTPM